ncbi:MAG: hypothetical protein KatS3mg115_0018 [Candidatus Poribacteria bacterium]|nr:MAG: hypothetical protein KatS3mg115_0018 [Candidatus Poribacteria bacterium]
MRRLDILSLLSMLVWVVSPVLAVVEPPVVFEGSKLSNVDGHHFEDLGNFHGQMPLQPGDGWHYWGAREPIVTDDWVRFPRPGEYIFIVKSKSDQFDAGDADKDIWAEFEVRLYPQDALKDLAESIGDLNALAGRTDTEIVLFREKARADRNAGDDWYTSETVVEFTEEITGQLAIWFMNDQWQPDPPPAKDRNLWILSMEIQAPFLAVNPKGKAAIRWAELKAAR